MVAANVILNKRAKQSQNCFLYKTEIDWSLQPIDWDVLKHPSTQLLWEKPSVDNCAVRTFLFFFFL